MLSGSDGVTLNQVKFDLHDPLKKKNKHKEGSFDYGAEACYVKQCNSVRPAFVLESQRQCVVIQLMHVYIPMGIERQHDIQSSVIARFCSHEMASSYLEIASEKKLGMGYLNGACTCTIPEEARKHGTRDEILSQWDALIQLRNLRHCYNVELEQYIVSGQEGWGGVKQLLPKSLGLTVEKHYTSLNN